MKKFKIVVLAYGKTITAVSDGTEVGTIIEAEDRYINVIRSSIRRGRKVNIAHSRYSNGVIAGYESPLALTAALCSVDESRSIVWSAPKIVTKFLGDNSEDCSRFVIEDYIEED